MCCSSEIMKFSKTHNSMYMFISLYKTAINVVYISNGQMSSILNKMLSNFISVTIQFTNFQSNYKYLHLFGASHFVSIVQAMLL